MGHTSNVHICNQPTSLPTKESISHVEICVNGVTFIEQTIIDSNGVQQITYKTTDGVYVPAPINFTYGKCEIAGESIELNSGAVSIANGSFSSTLGINGTSWVAPSTLKTVTILARRSNTSNATLTGGNKVIVNTTNGSVVLLTGESVTFSAEDKNIQNFISVTTIGNSAALVIYNTI